MAESKKTPEFRVSFPNVFKPFAFEGQDAKYSIVMLFPKSTDLKELQALAKKAIEDKWTDPVKREQVLKNPKFKNPFRDGDTERPDTDGYAGMIFITATSKQKPGVVDRNVQPIISEDEFYAGCYAKASVTAYAYDKAGNVGVAFGLQNVMKVRDGESFSGRRRPEDDFEPLGDEGVASGTPAAAPKKVSDFLN